MQQAQPTRGVASIPEEGSSGVASPAVAVGIVGLGADCTLRAIEAAHQALRLARPADGRLRIDCSAIEQADITLVQLIASAEASFALRDIGITLEATPICVRSAFARAGVAMPGAPSRGLPPGSLT